MTDELSARLSQAFQRATGAEVRIDELERLSAGASCESWSFVATDQKYQLPRRMVMRRPPHTDARLKASQLMEEMAPARAIEGELLSALHAAGLPVPPVELILTPADELGAGFVMDWIPGEPMPHRILDKDEYSEARKTLPAELARFRAEMNHLPELPADHLPVLQPADQLAMFRHHADMMGVENPGIELGLAWLADHLLKSRPPVLVHGDFRISNFLVTPQGLSAVIDWELAHLGDPLEDLGWLCVRSWRFSRPDLPAGGLTDRESLLNAYVAAGGVPASLDELMFWEVLGNIKWSLICLMQGHRFLQGDDRSIELAAIGRRVEEPIYDLLQLLDGRPGA